jgi:hypothetical protein
MAKMTAETMIGQRFMEQSPFDQVRNMASKT